MADRRRVSLVDVLALLEQAPRCRHPPGSCGELSWSQIVVAEWWGRHAIFTRLGPFAVTIWVEGKRGNDRHPPVGINVTIFGWRIIQRRIVSMMEDPLLFKILTLVCAAGTAPSDCTPQSALDIVQGEIVGLQQCMFLGQARLAPTGLAPRAGEVVKIVCQPVTRSAER